MTARLLTPVRVRESADSDPEHPLSTRLGQATERPDIQLGRLCWCLASGRCPGGVQLDLTGSPVDADGVPEAFAARAAVLDGGRRRGAGREPAVLVRHGRA